MKIISYSLFGYGKERLPQSFDFISYLRGLMICTRMNRLVYPDWTTHLETDMNTYLGFIDFFKALEKIISIHINKEEEVLCKAMLWRLRPVFKLQSNTPKYTHVLCRDLDSPSTYREAQAVHHWVMQGSKSMHAITDSISHNLPLLGGMIGVMPGNFMLRTGFTSWDDMIRQCKHDLSVKGSDQSFLNDIIYPMFAQKGTDSITQHYVEGHGKTWLSDWHDTIEDINIGLDEELKETNDICGHIGAAGWYEPIASKLINKYKDKFLDIAEAEKFHPDIFYWR